MLKVFRGVTNFYGNGSVYITDGEDVQKLEKHNYEIKSLKDIGDEIWITSGVVVALGACTELSSAIEQLELVLARLRAELSSEVC